MGMYKPNGRWTDTAAGLVKTARLKGKLKADASPSMLSLSNASEEIAKSLHIRQDAASAALYGLCAIGRVRWVDYDGKLVDCDEVTVSNFGGKPAFVVAEDVQDVVAEWSSPSR
jgi:hypothetical protein